MLPKITRRGFVGPHYRGVLGAARTIVEHFVLREDVVSIANELRTFAQSDTCGRESTAREGTQRR